MAPRTRPSFSAQLAGLLIGGLCLQGCVATTLAGATLGVAGVAVGTAAKVTVFAVKTTAKVGGAAAHVTTSAVGHALKGGSTSSN